MLQGKAEAKLIKAQPERFPPPAFDYIKEGFLRWWSGKSRDGLVPTIKKQLSQLEEVHQRFGSNPSMNPLTNIQVTSDKMVQRAGTVRETGSKKDLTAEGSWRSKRSVSSSKVVPTAP